MENLSQSDLINTIINLSNKVEQLKMQNDHLREIRLQLASLAVNSSYGNIVPNIEKTTNNSFIKQSIYVTDDNNDSQSDKEDLFSNVTSLISKPKLFSNKPIEKKLTDTVYHDSRQNLRNHEYKVENEFILGWLHSTLFIELEAQLIPFCTCYFCSYEVLYASYFLSQTVGCYIFSKPVFYSIPFMGHFTGLSNTNVAINPVLGNRCQLAKYSDKKYYMTDTQSFNYKSGLRIFIWNTEENFLGKFFDNLALKSVTECSYSSDYCSYLEIIYLRSHLGYLLSCLCNTDLSINPHSCFLRISVKRQANTAKVGTIEYQDRSVKSYSLSIAKSGQFKPPIKLVINSYSSVPKKISISKEKLQKSFLRRTNSVVDMRLQNMDKSRKNVSGDFSDSDSLKSRSMKSTSTNFLLSSSRKLWREKYKKAILYLVNMTISEIMLYTEFTISMLSNDLLELNFDNMQSIAQEYINRRKNEIIQSQLGQDSKTNTEKKNEEKSKILDDSINLNSLDVLESTFSKYSFHNKYFQSKNVYDMKNFIKSNISLNFIPESNQLASLNPGLSKFQVQEMIKMNPDILKAALNQSQTLSKISDSFSESSSTLVQSSQFQSFKFQNLINDDFSENKKTSSCCGDSLTYSDPDQDLSISFSQSDSSLNNDTSLISLGKLQASKKIQSQKRIPRNFFNEDVSKMKLTGRLSKLSKRRSSLLSDNEVDKRYTKSDHDHKDQRNRIRLSFLKHVTNMNKGDSSARVNSLRKKAASYILNSKMSYKNWQKESTTSAAAQIKNFLDNEVQDMISNKNYQCDKCSISFKLGTELRQHLRSHNLRKKPCAT